MVEKQVRRLTVYDVIIIGAGPGGYVAAERAGAKGKKVLIIEKDTVGGVCLNVGCIPTKTLLNSAKHYDHAVNSNLFGVHSEGATFNLTEAQEWKKKVVDTNVKGIIFLMEKYGVEIVMGKAFLVDKNTVKVDGVSYQADNIIIATGSSTFIPPIPGAHSKHVVTSTELLAVTELPESLTVIGGGVIGLEFASFFSMLGIPVHVIEMLDEIAPFMEKEFAKTMRRALKKVKFHLSSKVESIDGNKVFFVRKGKEEVLESDLILMAVGRKPNVQEMGFEAAGLEMNRHGLVVDDKMETNISGIYAIGDVIGKSLFAHSASRMAEVAVHTILGIEDALNYDAVPWAIYTYPEVASCGLTEDEAVSRGYDVDTATSLMRISARYYAENGNVPGLCKVVADRKTHRILGIHLLGSPSSEMIFGAALMIQTGMTTKDVRTTIFPHPSVSEVIRETVLSLCESMGS